MAKSATQFEEGAYQVTDLLRQLEEINETKNYESEDQRKRDRNVIAAIKEYSVRKNAAEIMFEYRGVNYGRSGFNAAAWKLKSGEPLIPDSVVAALRKGKGVAPTKPNENKLFKEFLTTRPAEREFEKIFQNEIVMTPEDFLEKHKSQIENGKKAEQIAFAFETERLKQLGLVKQDRPRSFAHITSAGYDLLSINEDGSDRFIEVKSISDPTRIYLSRNELEKSQTVKGYYLYCVNIESGRVYPIAHPNFNDRNRFKIEPINFLVSFKIEISQ